MHAITAPPPKPPTTSAQGAKSTESFIQEQAACVPLLPSVTVPALPSQSPVLAEGQLIPTKPLSDFMSSTIPVLADTEIHTSARPPLYSVDSSAAGHGATFHSLSCKFEF
jgi:hypothetical protein